MPPRSDYPILTERTYLVNHSLGAVPRQTRTRLQRYHDEWATLGPAAWEGPWWQAVRDFTNAIETLLGAKGDTVAPMQNATRAMAAVATSLDFSGDRNRVVMSDLEFTTSYPFWRQQERRGAQIVIVESRDGISVPAEAFEAAVDDKTLLVHTCHVYFRSGALQDIRRIAKIAHERGAYALIDGYQALGVVPTDVARSDVDFYVGGSHKWLCGGAGAGYLYVRPDLIQKLRPTLTGWFGLQDPFAYVKDLSEGAPNAGVMRFLDGTPNVPAVYAALEGVERVIGADPAATRRTNLALTRKIIDQAMALGVKVRTPTEDDQRGGMVCLDYPQSERATSRMVANGIDVDWRPACGTRVSPHFYNNQHDIDVFLQALEGFVAKATP